jgi:hypothetical protein
MHAKYPDESFLQSICCLSHAHTKTTITNKALEVHLHNPWLTYGIGLHRLREAGLLPEIFGHLDQRPLTLEQLHEFCKIFFIGDDGCIDLPHPRKNSWNNFFRTLKVLIDKEKSQWNSVKKKVMSWIDLDILEAKHGGQRHVTKNDWQKNLYSDNRRKRLILDSDAPDHSDAPDPPSDSRENEPLFEHTPPGLQRPCHSHMLSTSPSYSNITAIKHFLFKIPLMFPPTNKMVEPHEYFTKWKPFDSDAFAGVSSDEQMGLLLRGMTFFIIIVRCIRPSCI